MVKGKEKPGKRECESCRIEGSRGATRVADEGRKNRDAKQGANTPQFRDYRHRA